MHPSVCLIYTKPNFPKKVTWIFAEHLFWILSKKIPNLHLNFDSSPKQIYRPNMNKFENYFHRELLYTYFWKMLPVVICTRPVAVQITETVLKVKIE